MQSCLNLETEVSFDALPRALLLGSIGRIERDLIRQVATNVEVSRSCVVDERKSRNPGLRFDPPTNPDQQAMASRGLGKQQPPLWSLPVSQRPPLGLAALLTVTLPLTIGFIVVFDVGILATVLLLVLLYPLYCGSIQTRRTYRQLGKRAFGRLLVLIVNWFSPTELVLSAGRGIDPGEGWIERDSDGNLVSLKLPEKALWVRSPRSSDTRSLAELPVPLHSPSRSRTTRR